MFKESIYIMNLAKASLLSIVGIIYLFVSRTIATFFPSIFRILLVSQINTILSFGASLAVLTFYILFYKEYAQKHPIRESNGLTLISISKLMIVSSGLVVFLFAKGILNVFNLHFSFTDLINEPAINIIITWISAVCTMLFFFVFYKEISRTKDLSLKLPLLLAVYGSAVSVLIRTVVSINYFYTLQLKWLWSYTREYFLVFIPILSVIFLINLYFFYSFYRELERIKNLQI